MSNPNNLIPKFIVFGLLYFCSPESYIQEWEPCGKKTIKRKIIRSNSRSDSFHVSQLSKIENKMQTFDFCIYRNVLPMLPCVQYDAASIQWVILIRDFVVFVYLRPEKTKHWSNNGQRWKHNIFFFVDKVSGSGHASFIPWPITKIAFHPESARGENQNRFSSRWIMLNTLKHYLVMTRNKWEYAWVWFFCTLIEWAILCIYVDRFFLNVIFLLPTWTSKIDQIKCRDFLIYFSFVPSLCTAAIQYIYGCRNMEKKCVAIVIIVISIELFFLSPSRTSLT